MQKVIGIIGLAFATAMPSAESDRIQANHNLHTVSGETTGYMKQYLDDMEVFFHGSGQYDPVYFAKLESCIAKYDDTTTQKSQDAAWEGMGDYWKSNGTASDYMNMTDYWGQCLPGNGSRCPVGNYMEFLANKKGGEFGKDKMQIFEPCNYASNVAYYHSASRICDYGNFSMPEANQNGIKKSFATLAMGSAFWHGSHTYDGYAFDNDMIAIISYLAHQASVSSLKYSPVLTDLSTTKRSKTGLEVSEDLVEMFYSKPVDQWAQVLDKSDYPTEYYITFGAIVSTVVNLILPYTYTVVVISAVSKLILPSADANWLIEHYLPRLGLATKGIELTADQKSDLAKKGGAVIVKILYAFLWQEFFIPLPFLYNTYGLHVGAWLMPHLNNYVEGISGYKQTDEYFRNSENLYPGQDMCKTTSSHALWHEQSANGFVDIVLLADSVNFYMSQHSRAGQLYAI